MLGLQMQIRYSFPCLPFFLPFITLITTSFGEKDVTLFQNCSSPLSCGESFPDIKYPFWGGDRSPECGEEGFHVSCLQDEHLTINISDHTFRVLSINSTAYTLTIAPNALWNGGCPEFYRDISPFSPLVQQTTDLPLYYGCPGRENDNSRYQFSCTNNRNYNARIYYSHNDWDCKENIKVQALRSHAQELNISTASTTLEDVLQKGFIVEYKLNWIACFSCNFSKGLCWAGTNLGEPTCLCPDVSRNSSPCFPSDQIKGPSLLCA